MIAKKSFLQIATAALTAYVLCTVLIKNLRDKPWSISLPDMSRKYMSDSAFEHIQNRTLGVRIYLLPDRIDC
jgi:hypothetical protein